MSRYYNGTSAYKIDEIEYGVSPSVQESIAKRQQTRQNKKAAFIKRLRLCATFALVFAVAFGILFANAVVIEKASAVNDMQNQLSELTEENNQMRMDIEKNLDLSKIEEIAINELGMKRPDKYQVVYVNVEQSNYAEVSEEQKKGSGLSAFKESIGQFMEYIN